MPPTPQSLSESDIQHLAAELERGRHPTVWFTSTAVGMEADRSGKVVGLAEPGDPDFIQVKPAGTRDTLAFSPAELSLTRPARRPASRRRPSLPSRSRTPPPDQPRLW